MQGDCSAPRLASRQLPSRSLTCLFGALHAQHVQHTQDTQHMRHMQHTRASYTRRHARDARGRLCSPLPNSAARLCIPAPSHHPGHPLPWVTPCAMQGAGHGAAVPPSARPARQERAACAVPALAGADHSGTALGLAKSVLYAVFYGVYTPSTRRIYGQFTRKYDGLGLPHTDLANPKHDSRATLQGW